MPTKTPNQNRNQPSPSTNFQFKVKKKWSPLVTVIRTSTGSQIGHEKVKTEAE